ncbi:hypothetical protein DE146DRAFT_677266 [Phaeosphaeria sp. MPI-PUGE-AT-0046c]|nr:hypothetical protein DE146DRAFT_677266 [Phaeosphaeria sp. MPI-PUGE-AT-0046c]
MPVDADAIADCVLAAFDQLPEKRKPRPPPRWVKGLTLTALAKTASIAAFPWGNVLHDWHAEVLAIRAFNRFLLDQCLYISLAPHPTSDWVRQRSEAEHVQYEQQAFTIREDVQIHMYCSEAPCGDASMELIMEAQEDATPWTRPPPTVSDASMSSCSLQTEQSALRGRSNFSHLGAVRCKPSRPDAPPTLILPSSQYVPAACARAFSTSGRFENIIDNEWKGGYQWEPFKVQGSSREFDWSRRNIPAGHKAMPSNLSAVCTPAWQETLIGGVLQGRKQFDPRGASAICRRSMWATATQLACVLGWPSSVYMLGQRTYREMKNAETFSPRKQVKQDFKSTALTGWVKNTGDDDFELERETGVS